MKPELQKEWDQLNAAYDAAEEAGDDGAMDRISDQMTAFAEANNISDGCNFDPDHDRPAAPK